MEGRARAQGCRLLCLLCCAVILQWSAAHCALLSLSLSVLPCVLGLPGWLAICLGPLPSSFPLPSSPSHPLLSALYCLALPHSVTSGRQGLPGPNPSLLLWLLY